MQIHAPQQPQAPDVPNQVYAIGEFNGWQIPTSTDSKGAIGINLTDSSSSVVYYEGTLNLSGACNSFKIVSIDEETDTPKVWTTVIPPICLYTNEYGSPKMTSLTLDYLIDANPVTITNTKGEINLFLNFKRNFTGNCNLMLYSNVAPRFDIPDVIYAIWDNGDGDNGVYNLMVKDWNYLGYVWQTGSNPSILFSTKNNTSPDSKDCWGINPEENEQVGTAGKYFSLVKGGKAFTIANPEENSRYKLTVEFNMNQGIAYAYYEDINPYPQQIYVIGKLNNWNNTDDSFTLSFKGFENNKHVYEGVITRPDNLSPYEPLRFRFFTHLGTWSNDMSIGLYNPEGETVTFDSDNEFKGTAIRGGEGNWAIQSTWMKEGENLGIKMLLDDSVAEVFFTLKENSMSEVLKEDDEPANYFNLQGLHAMPTTPGIYILRKGTMTKKVIVR